MGSYSEAAQAAHIEIFSLFSPASFQLKETVEKLWVELRFRPNMTLNRVESTRNPGEKRGLR